MSLKSPRRIAAAALLFASASVLPAAELPQAFIELPVGSQATGVSADGSVVVGITANGTAFRWTEAGGYVAIGGGTGSAPSVSADGQTITSNALDSEGRTNPAIWLGGTDWQTLGGISFCSDGNGTYGTSFGVSGDGSIVVGLGYENGCNTGRGFSWQESTGMVNLGTLVPNRPSRANDISDDGQVIVGWNDLATGARVAVKWVDGVEQFILQGTNNNGEALTANRDGSIIAGRFCNFGSGGDAWIWDEATGDVTCVGLPSGGGLGENNAIWDTSDDGRVMGGWFHDNPAFRESVVYFDRQPVHLENHLAAYGFPALSTWASSGAVLAVSANRRVLAGWGRNAVGQFQGYIVKLGLDSPLLLLDKSGLVAELQWTPVTHANRYDVVRGELDLLLASDGDFTAATDICLASGQPTATFDDSEEPGPGEGYWYLVRPRQALGPGSYDTYAPSQVGSRDLEIDDATFGCP
jgi:probable HAF family extracellular repeat protein